MGLADVIQLDHCFPTRLQSFDIALTKPNHRNYADGIDYKGKHDGYWHREMVQHN